MATKMCFQVGIETAFMERIVEFEYIKGMAFTQKQKNVLSFHKSIQKEFPNSRIIEISTKSQSPLGVQLSAFNLTLDGYPLECVFQSSKVFEGNVQFPHLLHEEPKIAKQYIHENATTPLIGFKYQNTWFGLTPKTLFYDYIYITALTQCTFDTRRIADYDIFTDIEFNEKKSFNCQARSCAIYAHLLRYGKLEYYLSSIKNFETLYKAPNTTQISFDF